MTRPPKSRIQTPATRLDRRFLALADPTRRRIVDRLVRGPASVTELAQPLAMTLPAVVQHLRLLEDSGMVRTEKRGRVRVCRLEPRALDQLADWIGGRRRSWQRRLDALDTFLETTGEGER